MVFEIKECNALDKATAYGFTVMSGKKSEYAIWISNTISIYDEGATATVCTRGSSEEMTGHRQQSLFPGHPGTAIWCSKMIPDNVRTINVTVVLNNSDGDVYKASFCIVPRRDDL